MHRSALRLAGAVAALALVMAMGVGSARASTGAFIEPAGSISATSAGKVTFGSSLVIECDVTLNGSLGEGPVLAEAGEVIGSISEVGTANCEGGRVGGMLGLPWPVKLGGVTGSPPEAATGLELRVQGMAFNLSVFGGLLNCLYGGTAALTLGLVEGEVAYDTEGLFFQEEVTLPFVRGSGICPRGGGFSGTLTLPVHEVALGNPDYFVSKDPLRFGSVRKNPSPPARKDIRLTTMVGAVTIDGVNVIGDQVFSVTPNFTVATSSLLTVNFVPTAAQAYRATIELLEGRTVIWRFGVTGTGTN